MIVQELPCLHSKLQCLQVASFVALCHQFGTTHKQFCNEFLRLNAQCLCHGFLAYRFRWIEYCSRIFPIGVFPKQRVDAISILLGTSTINRAEVIKCKVGGRAGTICAGRLARASEPIELEVPLLRWISIVVPDRKSTRLNSSHA